VNKNATIAINGSTFEVDNAIVEDLFDLDGYLAFLAKAEHELSGHTTIADRATLALYRIIRNVGTTKGEK